jgi:hypothetical protein
MPRGSVPWPQRAGSSGGTVGAATRVGRPAQAAAGTTNPDVRPMPRQPAVEVNTVHLVDTCGHVIDMQTVSESTETAIAGASTLKTSGDVDHPIGDESEDFRRKQVVTALTRVQEDLKHIPPGKKQLLPFILFFGIYSWPGDLFYLPRRVKMLERKSIKMLN